VCEEGSSNSRLGGNVDVADFAGYVNNLGLPHPKLMEIAVPAKLRCGQPEASHALPEEPDWALPVYTFSGVWEIQPETLEEHSRDVQLIDVREPSEFADAIGHIPGARLIPLSQLPART
jgi:hypothetical protein